MSIDDRQLCDHALELMQRDHIITTAVAEDIRTRMDIADIISGLCRKQEDSDGVD